MMREEKKTKARALESGRTGGRRKRSNRGKEDPHDRPGKKKLRSLAMRVLQETLDD